MKNTNEPIPMYKRLCKLFSMMHELFLGLENSTGFKAGFSYTIPPVRIQTKLGVRIIDMKLDNSPNASNVYTLTYSDEIHSTLFKISVNKKDCKIQPLLKKDESCDWIHLAIKEVENIVEANYNENKNTKLHHYVEEERLGKMG